MELINKNHDHVREYAKHQSLSMVTLRESRVLYFSRMAIYECGLIHGTYMHVLTEGDRWFFFCNNEPTGFHMLRSNQKRHEAGFHVYSAALINMMLERTKAKIKQSFIIRTTNREYEGYKLHEILIHTPINYKG